MDRRLAKAWRGGDGLIEGGRDDAAVLGRDLLSMGLPSQVRGQGGGALIPGQPLPTQPLWAPGMATIQTPDLRPVSGFCSSRRAGVIHIYRWGVSLPIHGWPSVMPRSLMPGTHVRACSASDPWDLWAQMRNPDGAHVRAFLRITLAAGQLEGKHPGSQWESGWQSPLISFRIARYPARLLVK